MKSIEEIQAYTLEHRTLPTVQQLYQDTFYKLSKVLVHGDLYKEMSVKSKYAYALLQDRRNLSLSNNWYDEEGNLFFIYTISELGEILGMSKNTVLAIKRELENYKLLEQKVLNGKVTQLYLYNPVATEEDKNRFVTTYQNEREETKEGDEENPIQESEQEREYQGGSKSEPVQKLHRFKNCTGSKTAPVQKLHRFKN